MGRWQVEDNVTNYLFRSFKAKGGRVTYIELKNTMAFILQPTRFFMYRPSNIVTNTVELIGFDDWPHYYLETG
ncbi:MAG: hypothetical protein Sw2LagPseu_32630 [Shewanella algae]